MPIKENLTKISEIFTAVQYNRTCHQNYLKKLKKHFVETNFDDFVNEFINNLRIPLTYIEKHPNVENTLQFAVKFAIGLQPESGNEEEYEQMCSFLDRILEFLLTHYSVTNVTVRFRICYFLNMILNAMGDSATIDDEVFNKILRCMMERIVDKSPKVRAQAVIALHRLQEPDNSACPVINVYLFHLSNDPSAEVRRAILAKMAKTKVTLNAAIKRTRDIDDSVRKMAYLFISTLTVKSLTISQREQLISNGLQDSSEIVKKCVRQILIPSWLRHYNNNYINFMKAIDPETAAETVGLALNVLFKTVLVGNLIEQLPIDESKFVPIEQLTSEIILYWRYLVEFLKNENYTDEFDQVMPELSIFCRYIKDYIVLIYSHSNKKHEHISHEFILHQLFEMVKVHDLSDEVGRKNLKELIIDTLQTYDCSNKIIECIVKYFEKVVPDVSIRISLLIETINEIRLPTKINVVIPMSDDERHERKMLKAKLGMTLLEFEDEEYSAIQKKDYATAEAMNVKIIALREEIECLSKEPERIESQQYSCEEKTDSETVLRCLKIMYYMMQSNTIKFLSPPLKTLMDNIALPHINLENHDDTVLSLALKCVGLCCHVDKDLAKKYLMMYFLYISQSGNEEVWIAATEVIFDLLLKFGIEYFDTEQPSDIVNSNKKRRSIRLYSHHDEDIYVNQSQIMRNNCSDNIIKALMALLDSEVTNLQSVAIEGICKLILHKRINSYNIISQLIILWHNPNIKDNPFMSQCLCNFFNLYISKVPESQTILEKAYLPTLKSLINAPEMSILQKIDPCRVSEVIINLTCYTIHNNYSTHNKLAYTILNEILNPNSEILMYILIKSLKLLDVQLDGENVKNDILKALNDVEQMLNAGREKRLLDYIHKFRNKITFPETNHSNDNNNSDNNNDNNNNIINNNNNNNSKKTNNVMGDKS